MRAWAWGLPSTLAKSMPRGSMSSVKAGLPFTRRSASTFVSGLPTTAVWGTSGETHEARHRRRDFAVAPDAAGASDSSCPSEGRRPTTGFHRPGLLAAQRGRGASHRLDDLHVSGLPIEDPAQRVADLGLGGFGVRFQERLGRQHHRAGRVPGLHRPRLDEGLLDRVELAGGDVERLDRGHLVARGLGGEQHVGRRPAARPRGQPPRRSRRCSIRSGR